MRAFFVWHRWMEMGKKSLRHSIAPKLSQRGIFTLFPSSKFKCWTMVWLKASKSCVLPVGKGTCFQKAVQSALDWSLPLKKCELLSKATAFPVQWHIGRYHILPIMTNTAWEPAYEHLGWDSRKSAQKEHTEAHEFLKWNVPMGLLSTGVLNEKPDFGGTSWHTRHSNSGNETWEMERTNLPPCWCKTKTQLVRSEKQPQRPLHILPWLMGPDLQPD